MTQYRKKLIEVALPLDAINKESAREKSIRHGHPSTLHLWWARRPLAACRAVLFAQLVDDPSEYMPDEKSADEERQRLFDLIEELVKWENINNEEVLDKARLEIACSVARDLGEPVPVGKEAIREFLATKAPPVLDPFAGGGSIPLEAQRLGLRAYASDLNPVAVLINKALIEIPPKFADMPPVHPPENEDQQLSLINKEWKGAEGLAEDVRYYGKWMRDNAEKQIGHLYPKYKISQKLLNERSDLKDQGLKAGDELTVIAWLWARTVKCPNPVCSVNTPLFKSFGLSKKTGKEQGFKIKIDSNHSPLTYNIDIIQGQFGAKTAGNVNRNGAYCLSCQAPIYFEHIRTEGKAGRLDYLLTVIIAEGKNRRLYFSPEEYQITAGLIASPQWEPDTELQGKAAVNVPLYGLIKHSDLYLKRQLFALNIFSSLVEKVYELVLNHIGEKDNFDANTYAKAIAIYLAFAVDRCADYWTTIATWHSSNQQIRSTFARQAIPMTWDFVEANPFSNSSGGWNSLYLSTVDSFRGFGLRSNGNAYQHDAATHIDFDIQALISTDPPYYDNISYADLSDLFYVWLRKSLNNFFPHLLATVLAPKSNEMVATPYRFEGNRNKAKFYFETQLKKAFINIRTNANSSYPVTIYYAFKQVETDYGYDYTSQTEQKTQISTGWETMLEGLLTSGYQINGTWPMRSEQHHRMIAHNANALASSIVIVCRLRTENMHTTVRREFLANLRREIPQSLRQLQQGNIAPVDFAQAAIGPGMAVYSRYQQVLEADGSPMSIRTALALINHALDEFLTEQEGEYDTDTRWTLAWFEQYGFNDGPFGVAETLSKAKNTSINGLQEAGVLVARAGKVRLLSRTELKEDWDPSQDRRPTAWEAVQYLIRALDSHGEQAAALLLSRLGGLGEVARDLAYRLYTICERKGWAQDALGYNMLVVAWPRLKEISRGQSQTKQERLF
jgi:putative DNA methylase